MVNQGLRATSKSSLKLQCLFCAKGDLKEAKELYDFFASDMPDLPDQDPVPLTWQQNTAELGRLAAERLIDTIEHPHTTPPKHIVVQGRLLEGETVRQLG